MSSIHFKKITFDSNLIISVHFFISTIFIHTNTHVSEKFHYISQNECEIKLYNRHHSSELNKHKHF